jgi:predicted ATP-dependent endonuclease of OLD family
MELFQIEITGFKKFKEKTTLKTRGKVLAILGANEAGKSSLLKALGRLNDSDPFEPHEISHGSDDSHTTIKATYLLSPEDRKAAALTTGTWFEVTKYPDGARKWSIRPTPPDRDYKHRSRLIVLLKKLAKRSQAQITEIDPSLFDETQVLLERLFTNESELSDEGKLELTGIAQRWGAAAGARTSPKVREIFDVFTAAIDSETKESRRLSAGKKLWSRLPEFLLFDQDNRNLKSSYAWSEIASAIPTALSNLSDVAELDLQKLIDIAITNPNDPEFDTLMERANAALERNFQAAWNQSAVSIVLAPREQNLLVQVYNNDRSRTDLAQRSDGLRQFVALRCFTAAHGMENFILLIDEAEQHLHYDAQADLVQMLTSQTVASKVIYTTHSVGCLPEDLGNGIRLVLPTTRNSDLSKIENKFWSTREKDEAAFSPILMGMGASTMAFFPTRAAILVEGPVDTILLPTMFREALGCSILNVQFVHGLSEDGYLNLPILNSTGTRVCYLLDNDEGGHVLKKRLIELKVDDKRIFQLPMPNGNAELEDFVDSKLLAEAASNVAHQHLGIETLVAGSDLPKIGKWDFIAQSCKDAGRKPLDKVPVAYELLELLDADPQRQIVEKRLAVSFTNFASNVMLTVQERAT